MKPDQVILEQRLHNVVHHVHIRLHGTMHLAASHTYPVATPDWRTPVMQSVKPASSKSLENFYENISYRVEYPPPFLYRNDFRIGNLRNFFERECQKFPIGSAISNPGEANSRIVVWPPSHKNGKIDTNVHFDDAAHEVVPRNNPPFVDEPTQ